MCMGSCASACAQQAGSAHSPSLQRRHQGCRDQGRETGERQSALTVSCSSEICAHERCQSRAACAAIRYTLDASTSVLAFDDSDASLLGTGSSASVYRGNLNGQPVAVKVSLSRNAPRCLAGGARLASARRAERVATLSTGSAGGPCRYGVRVLKGYSRGTQGILKGCSEGAQGYSGGTQGYSRGTICFGVQAFRLQGLSQSARAKATFSPSHSRLSEY